MPGNELALVLSGGGARAAYQAGLLKGIAERFPELEVQILTGVSAGAINALYLAAQEAPFDAAVDGLVRHWSGLSPEQVFRVDVRWLGKNVLRWGARLVSGGMRGAPQVRGLVDTAPLRAYLRHVLG
ncbi:MAG TPA: patatin-like phospholipase family protein, partial [Nannocystis sp.]